MPAGAGERGRLECARSTGVDGTRSARVVAPALGGHAARAAGDVGALEHRLDLGVVATFGDPGDDRYEAGEQVEHDPLGTPGALDAEIGDGGGKPHVDEPVDGAPVLRQQVGLLEE